MSPPLRGDKLTARSSRGIRSRPSLCIRERLECRHVRGDAIPVPVRASRVEPRLGLAPEDACLGRLVVRQRSNGAVAIQQPRHNGERHAGEIPHGIEPPGARPVDQEDTASLCTGEQDVRRVDVAMTEMKRDIDARRISAPSWGTGVGTGMAAFTFNGGGGS